jgi:hypothetical protein
VAGPGQRVESEVALEMDEAAARHVANFLEFKGTQGVAAAPEALDVVEVPPYMQCDAFIPPGAIQLAHARSVKAAWAAGSGAQSSVRRGCEPPPSGHRMAGIVRRCWSGWWLTRWRHPPNGTRLSIVAVRLRSMRLIARYLALARSAAFAVAITGCHGGDLETPEAVDSTTPLRAESPGPPWKRTRERIVEGARRDFEVALEGPGGFERCFLSRFRRRLTHDRVTRLAAIHARSGGASRRPCTEWPRRT